MAFERFARETRAAVVAASREAEMAGQRAVEAEHLLLALALHPELKQLGLDHGELVKALAQEEEQSLAAVGVSAWEYDLPAAHALAREPRLATSAKLALQRALTVAARRGERRIRVEHLLLGVLSAEHGRVPRALNVADIDIDELRARL